MGLPEEVAKGVAGGAASAAAGKATEHAMTTKPYTVKVRHPKIADHQWVAYEVPADLADDADDAEQWAKRALVYNYDRNIPANEVEAKKA